ncbi:hypothetical protein GCM10023093_11200 [Nemorincola caseinilytica]|uniref:T9SS C-terminal target domain-containing protein n=1 Tax=Nemorincola caseinilytica TaxID=2054315 RepID=A0ABP8N8R3_9BACT
MVLLGAGVLGITGGVSARENVGKRDPKAQQLKSTASGCQPSVSSIDLDINNVRARLMTGGDMWWNNGAGNAAYEIPKGSGRHSQFAASCWIGGYDKQGQLKVAAQTYRQDGNDYWPGALDDQGKITSESCQVWDHFWKVDRSTINRFKQAYKIGADIKASDYEVINTWPAVGNNNVVGNGGKITLNPVNTYAPFIDVNGDGRYQPEEGEYPDIKGDQYIWWVFNDAGNVKQQSLTAAMGIEVQTSGFAYATQDFLNNATFYNYRVINRGTLTIDSTYIAVWDDADLGYYMDDFIGCDTARGLGILYNGSNNDGQIAGNPANSYGLNPPQIALDYFQGPKRPIKINGKDTIEQLKMTNFTYYNNDPSIIGNPTNGIQIYYYMTGSIRNGQRFSYDYTGPAVPSKGYGAGPVSNYVFWGDPSDNTQWSECACGNNPGDRRFVFSSGPFQLIPGAINDITFGTVWAAGQGGCPSANFKTIKNIDDGAQALFDNNFKTIEGPEAPRLVVRELDKKLIFYMVNDYGSNNYGENYGRSDGKYNDSLLYHQVVVKSKGVSIDSLYKFQGYRVFQLANSQVTAAEIFDPNTGEVDESKAKEVFQCDVADSISQIVNYVKSISVSDTTHAAQIKVKGRDSGIVHSFQLTQDAFATGNDKRFVNYRNYYFVAIAYAYNNFASFNPKNTVNTQDVPYLASSHGAGGTEIKVVTALPNPANGAMGDVINSDYGAGVIVKRIQGTGNGGNDVKLDEASEEEALTKNAVAQPTYQAGFSPIDVKVVDPVKVPAMDWVLQIHGTNTILGVGAAAIPGGIDATSGSWTLTGYKDGAVADVIYSERDLGTPNEQILEKYGISVDIRQVAHPGSKIKNTKNGYITSDVKFNNPEQPWLWGVQDESDSSFANWLRSGAVSHFNSVSSTNPCYFNDFAIGTNYVDEKGQFASMFADFTPMKSTWGPYGLSAYWYDGGTFQSGTGSFAVCGHHIGAHKQTLNNIKSMTDVDLVFTKDKSKWTRCAVIETQEDTALAENKGRKFYLRKHKGWNLEVSGDGNSPVYSESADDEGMSWFPGYAVNPTTGERLNIVFGEDSYLSSDQGDDMIWNPAAPKGNNGFNPFDNSIEFGGKHYTYVLTTKYDSCKEFVSNVKRATPSNTFLRTAYSTFQWAGIPMRNPLVKYLSLQEGLIPTTTRLRFRVDRPYMSYAAVDSNSAFAKPGTNLKAGEWTNPYYTFSTKDMAKSDLVDNQQRDTVLDKILAVPNPYYGYSGYEKAGSRYDTKIRIINLPARASVNIYTLDGILVRSLSKSDPGVPYLDWDIRNTAGLPVASGMYLIHVRAEGIGEKVIKWFGSLRPLDVTQY